VNTAGIVQVGDPVLRQVCPLVTEFDDELRRLGDRLFNATIAWGRVGVAAPQIGVSAHVFAVRLDKALPRFFANAEIVHSSGVVVDQEGCLSVAERWFDVSRSASVTVRAQDVSGEQFEVGATGRDARALQHEIDHLSGILVIDRAREQLGSLVRQRRRANERELAKVEAA
jgi:peptide deformylase